MTARIRYDGLAGPPPNSPPRDIPRDTGGEGIHAGRERDVAANGPPWSDSRSQGTAAIGRLAGWAWAPATGNGRRMFDLSENQVDSSWSSLASSSSSSFTIRTLYITSTYTRYMAWHS
ncbi:hypothetical protein LY76DRAFT_381905 [Colletotrichum caudatum]|nr:hypothetical protein LY76DRAFT_381905 [Colletotrichum caudatum]